MNKKFGLIETFFLAIPILTAFLNATFSTLKNFSWGYTNVNLISKVAFSIAIIGNVYIFWQSKRCQPVNKIWQFTSVFLVIILALLLYVGSSVSNFGF